MNFQYQFKLGVPVDKAWAVLMDVKRVAPCLPGAAIESGEGDNYVGRVKVKLGPIELTYRGDVTFVERDDAAKRAVINVAAKEVKGAGAAKATLTLDVAASGAQTEVSVGSEFTVSGKAAQFGRGVMEEVGEKLMAEFAARLSKLIAADNEAAAVSASVPAPEPAAVQESTVVAFPTAQAAPSEPAQTPAPAQRTAQPASQPAAVVHASPYVNEDDVMDVMAAVRGPIIRRAAVVIAVLVVIGTVSALALHSL